MKYIWFIVFKSTLDKQIEKVDNLFVDKSLLLLLKIKPLFIFFFKKIFICLKIKTNNEIKFQHAQTTCHQ